MPINKNAIKLAQMLDLNVDKAQKLTDVMSLSDLAALTNAVNSDDFLTVREIFNRYKHEIDDLPTPQEVKQYYDDQMLANNDADEALASTADFYGIKGEDVQALLGRVSENQKKDRESVYIPDEQVARAYKNVKEMLAGGKSDGSIMEVKRAWQRRMFYGLIDPVTAAVIQPLIDMTPMEVMQQYCKINHYGEPALEESQLSLEAMLDKVIEDHLHNIDSQEEELPNTIIAMDMGTIEEAPADTREEIYKGWIVRTTTKAKNGKFQGRAFFKRKNGEAPLELSVTDKASEKEVINDLKQKIDSSIGAKDIGHADSVSLDFNAAFTKMIIQHHEKIWILIDEYNGKPILLVSHSQQPGFKGAIDRNTGSTFQVAPGAHGVTIAASTANKIGLKHARYKLGDEIKGFAQGVEAYPLEIESAVQPGEKILMKEPAITVVPYRRKLIKSISDKKF